VLALAVCAIASKQVGANQGQANSVADDVLFLVLGKMSLYDQSAAGDLTLRNHHFVAEIMPKEGRKIESGTLTSGNNASEVLTFEPEGTAFLAHGARVTNPRILHDRHPDGTYVFSYETQSGRMDAQEVSLQRRSTTDDMPGGASVAMTQNGVTVNVGLVDYQSDLKLSWETMPGNKRVASSDLDDLVFVLVFDCFGNNVAHSGRPYQGGPYLSYKDTKYLVPSTSLNPGMTYTAIVEQATADVAIFEGVPAISTYATLTFLKFSTIGTSFGQRCEE
jgi:hypothetical protein